jgi:hypothetical protein
VNYVRPNETEIVEAEAEAETIKEVIPSFASSLEVIKISNQDANVNYYSPEIKDAKVGSYVLKVKGYDNLDCKCVSIRDLGLKGFNLHILTSKLTKKDVGEHLIETEIYLNGIGKSLTSNKQSLKIKISYKEKEEAISGADITTVDKTIEIKKRE